MVTKHSQHNRTPSHSSVLAKIFMVTKHTLDHVILTHRSVLAKIFMVTKPQKYGSTFLNVIEY